MSAAGAGLVICCLLMAATAAACVAETDGAPCLTVLVANMVLSAPGGITLIVGMGTAGVLVMGPEPGGTFPNGGAGLPKPGCIDAVRVTGTWRTARMGDGSGGGVSCLRSTCCGSDILP